MGELSVKMEARDWSRGGVTGSRGHVGRRRTASGTFRATDFGDLTEGDDGGGRREGDVVAEVGDDGGSRPSNLTLLIGQGRDDVTAPLWGLPFWGSPLGSAYGVGQV